jgi:hypothetical protein
VIASERIADSVRPLTNRQQAGRQFGRARRRAATELRKAERSGATFRRRTQRELARQRNQATRFVRRNRRQAERRAGDVQSATEDALSRAQSQARSFA